MKIQSILSLFILAFVTVVIQGCANKFSYSDANVSFKGVGSGKLVIATHDLRPYITNANKTPDFVGVVRGGYGNPFDVTTESGKSLAEEFTSTLASSMQRGGFTIIPVFVNPLDNNATVKAKMLAAGGDKGLLLLLKEWKSDTYVNTSLFYEMTLQVLDGSAKVLGEKFMNGTDSLGGSFNTYKHVHAAVPKAFKDKLEELINSPEIQSALTLQGRTGMTAATSPVSTPAPQEKTSSIKTEPSPETGQKDVDEALVGSSDAASNTAGDVESRLEKLTILLEKKLISEEEFNRERKRVLSSM